MSSVMGLQGFYCDDKSLTGVLVAEMDNNKFGK